MLKDLSELAGRTFVVDLGAFAPRFTFLDANRMRVEAEIGPTSVDEVVEVVHQLIRPRVHLVAWTEKSGNFVVQVQDHENGTVLNHARLADGNLFQASGSISET